MTHIMPLLKGIRIDPCPAGIAYVILPLADLLEIRRELAEALEHVDLEGQTASARIVIENVLQGRVRDEPAVPVVLAVDLNGRKTRRQRTARHDVLGSNGDFLAVKIGKAAGPHVYRPHAESHLLGVVY